MTQNTPFFAATGTDDARHRVHEILFAGLFLLAIGTLVGLAYISYTSGQDVVEIGCQRAILRERLNADALLLQSVLDTEMQARALLLTDDASYVSMVQHLQAECLQRLETFTTLVKQGQSMPELPAADIAPEVEARVRTMLGEFAADLDAWQHRTGDSARMRWQHSGATARMALVRQGLEQMQLNNENKLNALRMRFDSAMLKRSRIVTAGNVTALLWLVGAFFWLRHDRTLRWRTEGALRKASHAATAADRAKSEFLANMSHEIRTPLNAVVGMNDLLLDTHLSAEQADYARISRDAGRALLRIVHDILDFSHLDTHTVVIEFVPFSLIEIVESQVDIVAERARAKDLQLYCFIEPKLQGPRIGDPARIAQILLNFLSNAIKYTPGGGRVRVHVQIVASENSAESDVVRFEVMDTGIGIDAETQNVLFKPFSQADNSMSRRYGGTGLGLSICKGLVDLMRGRIGVTSTLGEGSTFFVELTLPIAKTQGAVASVSAPGPLSGLVALVFDPDEQAARIAGQIVGLWGVEARIVHSVAQAEATILEARRLGQVIEVVMLRMPEPQAVAFVAQMRANEAWALDKTPVIFAPETAAPTGQSREHSSFNTQLFLPIKQSDIFDALCKLCRSAVGTKAEVAPLAIAAEPHTKSSHLVLVVEDTPINQILALRQLEKLGYTGHAVATGHEAIEALSRIPYMLVLMDCQMPELDGYATTRAIRTLEQAGARSGHLPIVALAANALVDDETKCLAAGMDAYLAKPFTKDDLLAVLLRFLD